MIYADFCRHYHSATGVHIALLEGKESIYSSLGEALQVETRGTWPVYFSEQNPAFCSIPPHTLYGIVRIDGTDQSVVLGPVYNIAVSDALLDQLLDVLRLPKEMKNHLSRAINETPRMNSLQLARHLSLIHYLLNHEDIPYEQLYSNAEILTPDDDDLKKREDRLESGETHNAYYYEVGMYQKVREGNTEQLSRYFKENANVRMSEGVMAGDPLRHAKNIFLSVLSRTGFIGAIPGGLDVEKTYQLMDYYSQEAEKLTSVEAVSNLQYAMVMDFCHRTGEAKRLDNISSDVWHCMNYIRSHVYEPITVANIAADVHRSSSYVTKKFRTELNTHITAYVTRCKLEEAQTLLVFSNKTLAEISHDLCFSTQSYFQNLFRKHFGITPAEYRRQSRMI